jgi:hypothetical protein
MARPRFSNAEIAAKQTEMLAWNAGWDAASPEYFRQRALDELRRSEHVANRTAEAEWMSPMFTARALGFCSDCGDANCTKHGHCVGCDSDGDVAQYDVTFTDGTTERCAYCSDCASLARMNWNGETAAIKEAA